MKVTRKGRPGGARGLVLGLGTWTIVACGGEDPRPGITTITPVSTGSDDDGSSTDGSKGNGSGSGDAGSSTDDPSESSTSSDPSSSSGFESSSSTGVDEVCTQAPVCEGAQVPPVIDVHADFLDDPMAYIPPPERFDHLTRQVAEAPEAMRILAAALADPRPDESTLVSHLRGTFAARPEATAAVLRQLEQVGMPSPAAYRLAHPDPTAFELAARIGAANSELGFRDAVANGGIQEVCDDPRVRLRVASITVYEEVDDITNDRVYCLISSEASLASELKITPLTPPLDEGDSYVFGLEPGLVWGQTDLVSPAGNLLVTYNCIESDDTGVYEELLQSIGNAAFMAGAIGIPGVDGWIFPTIGIVANLVASLLSLDGDDLLFNASQVIPEDALLELTTGAYWHVRRDGTSGLSDWDWELRVEIWGCHD